MVRREKAIFHRGAVSGVAMAFESRITLVVMRMTVALSRLSVFDPSLGRYSDSHSSCEQVFHKSENAISTRKASRSVDCRPRSTCQRNATLRCVRHRGHSEIRSFRATVGYPGYWRSNLSEADWPVTVCTLGRSWNAFILAHFCGHVTFANFSTRGTQVALMVPSSRTYPTRLPTFSSDHFGNNREDGRA